MELNLENAIVIFDDASNVENAAEEGCSSTLSLESLKELNFEPLKEIVWMRESNHRGELMNIEEEDIRILETVTDQLIDKLQKMKDDYDEELGNGKENRFGL